MVKENLNGFESGLSIIDTTTYHNFTIDRKIFMWNCIYNIEKETIYKCDPLFRGNYIQLRSLLITLFIESPARNYFNLLRIITLLYHMYIEYEVYNLAYNTKNPLW